MLTVDQFILDILHGHAPSYESASDVLNYLTGEANAFVERTDALKELKIQRQDLLFKLACEGLWSPSHPHVVDLSSKSSFKGPSELWCKFV